MSNIFRRGFVHVIRTGPPCGICISLAVDQAITRTTAARLPNVVPRRVQTGIRGVLCARTQYGNSVDYCRECTGRTNIK